MSQLLTDIKNLEPLHGCKNEGSNFTIYKNPEGTYHIECQFVVYREKFGHHPDWLPQNEEDGKRFGFSTKFWFLIEDNISFDDIEKRYLHYTETYDSLISEIENDDTRWNEFPFKDKPVVYSK